ncbi:CHAT domain-containing protein [Fusarium sp. Ph1]|nr:CHAT domain-containing protein [Fusarium sp. Ph1]
MTQKILETMPHDHPDFAETLHSLGSGLDDRFSHIGALQDIEEAISWMTKSIQGTPVGDLDLSGRWHDLALAVGHKSTYTGQITDIEEAISIARRAVEATPQNDVYYPGRLHNLSIQLSSRYTRTGEIVNLDESLDAIRQAIKLTPQDSRLLGQRYHCLAMALRDKYESSGDMAVLEESVYIAREAIKTTPQDVPNAHRASKLASLASQLGARYLRRGRMEDLEEAINVARNSIKVTPVGDPTLSGMYTCLSIHLRNRYFRIGSLKDLEEAIDVTRKAIAATPQGHQERGSLLLNLSVRLGIKYARTKDAVDFDESIKVAQQAIEATPDDHPRKPTALQNLGCRLRNKYLRTNDLDDLAESIRMNREAIEASQGKPPGWAGLFSSLALKVRDKYFRTKAMEDLEEAISSCRIAVEETPKDDPNLAQRLNSLGNRLRTKHSRTKVATDLEEAIQCFHAALHHEAAPIRFRINAGKTLLSFMDVSLEGGRDAYLVAETTIQLVPLLSPPSLQTKDKQHLLSAIAGLASDAAAIALLADKGPLAAVRLLETGRGVLASSLQDLRVDISGLEERHPELARSFVTLRDQLDAPLSHDEGDPEDTETYAGSDQQHEAVNRMPVLLREIRGHPGFERFLLPPSEAEMKHAAARGPIVVINVSRHRCDALIVEKVGMRVIKLPQLSPKKILARAPHVRSLETLDWLWTTAVHPVLDALGFSEPPTADSWPHVWWIPTGPLVGFPFHAAGKHLDCNSNASLDRVVSSYGSCIKTIIHSRQQQNPPIPAKGFDNVVLVAMQDTPGQKSLQHASSETIEVQAMCELMGRPWTQPKACKKAVLSAIEGCMIFHFAGHGSTDEESPLASRLLLEDWKQDPLTVASLLETNLSSKSPFLAYLSACGTGQVRDNKSVDESIHLTGAFQLAGFRHVVGTLWEVDDELCVTMAKLVYQFLQKSGICDDAVGYGLHFATRKLRDVWVGEQGYGEKVTGDPDTGRDVLVCDDTELRYPLWVPYVHYGV